VPVVTPAGSETDSIMRLAFFHQPKALYEDGIIYCSSSSPIFIFLIIV